MGSWSTSAPSLPSGSSWSADVTTGYSTSGFDYDWKYNVIISIARGSGNTIYVRAKLQTQLRDSQYQYNSCWIGAELKIGSSGSWESSNRYNCGNHTGTSVEQTVYYTGTASPGTSIAVRAYNDSSHYGGSKTLTAPALITYSVAYNGNGKDSGSTSDQTKVHGVNLTLRQNGYTKAGYAFTGWNTRANGTGTSYAAGGTYSANADVTLYAQWVQTNLPVYANVGGTVKQIAKAYANVNGAIKECRVYANVNGEIKEIV